MPTIKDVAREAGVSIATENYYQHAYRATLAWLAMQPEQRPTAIVALTDLMAMGVMNAAADAGLRVGPDLSVVGFDDIPITGYLRRPLTEIGDQVVTMLIEVY